MDFITPGNKIVLLVLLAAVSFGRQNACPNVGDPGTKTAAVFIKSTNGACSLTSGGFVKSWTSYKAHFQATVTGGCVTYAQQCVGLPPQCTCVQTGSYLRTIGGTYLYDLKQGSTYFGVIQPTSQGTVQHIDTTVPTGTQSTGVSWLPTVLGQHSITSNSGWNATPCNLTPTVSLYISSALWSSLVGASNTGPAGRGLECCTLRNWRVDPNRL